MKYPAHMTLLVVAGFIAVPSAAVAQSATARAYDWTGFYLGAHAGYAGGNSQSSLEFVFAGVPQGNAGLAGLPTQYGVSASGFVGGVQAGYNFQSGAALFGFEADASYSGIRGATTFNGSVTSGAPPIAQDVASSRQQEVNWLATFRARAGYLPSESVLLYVTGGLVAGGVKDSMQLAFLSVGGTTYAGGAAATRFGWTAGGGAEFRIAANVTAKFEYLYFDLGSSAVTGLDVVSANNPFQTQSRFDHTGHIARLGLNYQFGSR